MSQPGMEHPWDAPDGTRWLHFPAFGEWHGWVPYEDGLYVYTEAEFDRSYGKHLLEPSERSGTAE